MKFTEYCQQNGIVLLKDDMKYLRKLLSNIPESIRKRILKCYSDEWLSQLKINEKSSQKQNLARRNANLALPEIIKQITGEK